MTYLLIKETGVINWIITITTLCLGAAMISQIQWLMNIGVFATMFISFVLIMISWLSVYDMMNIEKLIEVNKPLDKHVAKLRALNQSDKVKLSFVTKMVSSVITIAFVIAAVAGGHFITAIFIIVMIVSFKLNTAIFKRFKNKHISVLGPLLD